MVNIRYKINKRVLDTWNNLIGQADKVDFNQYKYGQNETLFKWEITPSNLKSIKIILAVYTTDDRVSCEMRLYEDGVFVDCVPESNTLNGYWFLDGLNGQIAVRVIGKELL